MRDVPISRIMTENPTTIAPDTTVDRARELLEPGQIHHLPVVQSSTLVGIVSAADLLKLYLLDPASHTGAAIQVGHIMQRDPETLSSNATLRNAAERLANAAFHALPVTAGNNILVGIVTSADVIDYVLRHLPREDGSLQGREPHGNSRETLDQDQLTAVVKNARASLQGHTPATASDRALVSLDTQNRALKAACHAAELYLRSGHGEHEHSVLARSLAALRNSAAMSI